MTPYEHSIEEKREKERLKALSEDWACPLSNGGRKLYEVVHMSDYTSII